MANKLRDWDSRSVMKLKIEVRFFWLEFIGYSFTELGNYKANFPGRIVIKITVFVTLSRIAEMMRRGY